MRKFFFSFAWLLAATIANATPQPETILVCYPGGSVNVKDATGAMGAMLRVVERVGQWPENSFTSLFTAKADECRKQMAATNPRFAITSLGLYLELRQQYHLLPLIQPKIRGQTRERYRVLVQKDKYKTLGELQGKTLGGTVLDEPSFIGSIVFAGHYDPASFFILKSSNQGIRALRGLDKGELDAVILNEQQFAGLGALHLQSPLEVIFISQEIPLMGVVANTTLTSAEERSRFGKALEEMCFDTEGKKLCDLFGVESFTKVDATTFEPMEKLWLKEK